MKYCLGYYNRGAFESINLEANITSDMLSLAKFTTSFASLIELKDYLYDKNLIPKRDVELCYLIDGKPVKFADNVFTLESASYFKKSRIKDIIYNHRYNDDFLYNLFLYYLTKYGVIDEIKKYIHNKKNDSKGLLKLLKQIAKISNDSSLCSDIYVFLNKVTYQEIIDDELLNNIIDKIANLETKEIIDVYYLLRSNLNLPKIPALFKINTLLDLIKHDNISDDGYTHDMFNIFVDKLIFSKDHISSRACFELAAFVAQYDSKKEKEKTNEEYSYNETDEFLEEDDFIRMDSSSEREGILLRSRKLV